MPIRMLFRSKQKPKSYIFRPWFTKNGVKYKAKDYGYKAWRIPIYE